MQLNLEVFYVEGVCSSRSANIWNKYIEAFFILKHTISLSLYLNIHKHVCTLDTRSPNNKQQLSTVSSFYTAAHVDIDRKINPLITKPTDNLQTRKKISSDPATRARVTNLEYTRD